MSQMQAVEMTVNEWEERYRPEINHLNPEASWQHDYKGGFLFETFGEEEMWIYASDPRRVWTLVDGENGQEIILNGYKHVNRLGYFICEVPWADGDDILVQTGENNE